MEAARPIALRAVQAAQPDANPTYPLIVGIAADWPAFWAHDGIDITIDFSSNRRYRDRYPLRHHGEDPLARSTMLDFIHAIWTQYNDAADEVRPGMLIPVREPVVWRPHGMAEAIPEPVMRIEGWIEVAERLRVENYERNLRINGRVPDHTHHPGSRAPRPQPVPAMPPDTPAPYRDPNVEAARKGYCLLMEFLNEQQKHDYHHYGFFKIRGGTSGREYTIMHGTAMNIWSRAPKCLICLTTREWMVTGDVLLTQKLAFELDELKALAEANMHGEHYYIMYDAMLKQAKKRLDRELQQMGISWPSKPKATSRRVLSLVSSLWSAT